MCGAPAATHVVHAVTSNGTLVALWIVRLTQLFSVLTQEQMRVDQPGEILFELRFDCFLYGSISCRVVFLLFTKTQSQQDAQAVRLQSEDSMHTSKQENLFSAGFAYAGKFSQRLFRLRQRKKLQGLPHISFELVHRNQGNLFQAMNALLGMHAAELCRF